MAMWRGETDLATLTAGIDLESAELVRLILHADDECYMETHRAACEERDLTWVDPTYVDERATRRIPAAIPEGVPTQQAGVLRLTLPKCLRVSNRWPQKIAHHCLYNCALWSGPVCSAVQSVTSPGTSARRNRPCPLPRTGTAPDLAGVFEDSKAPGVPARASREFGVETRDVPFVKPHDLVAGGLEKEFHQKRFLRHARKLPIRPLQENRYDVEWIRKTEAEVNPEALATARAANLALANNPIDQHFADNILIYRRIRQLADPEYAMSTAARQKLRGRLCPGGFHAERDEARRKVARTAHAQAGSVIIEAIWQGDLSLDEINQRLTGLGFPQPDHMHRLAELILHADNSEFDDDVHAEERVAACDERHADEFFRDSLVKLRRIGS